MTDQISARTGFFPVVAGDEVHLTQAGSSAIFSGGDVTMAQGGSNFLLSAGGASIEQGGAMTLACLGDVSVEQGGAAIVAARSVDVKQGFVGVALGASVSLEDCRVVMSPIQAAAAGAGFAVAVALIRMLARRR